MRVIKPTAYQNFLSLKFQRKPEDNNDDLSRKMKFRRGNLVISVSFISSS
jgi:hypothetical protein